MSRKRSPGRPVPPVVRVPAAAAVWFAVFAVGAGRLGVGVATGWVYWALLPNMAAIKLSVLIGAALPGGGLTVWALVPGGWAALIGLTVGVVRAGRARAFATTLVALVVVLVLGVWGWIDFERAMREWPRHILFPPARPR